VHQLDNKVLDKYISSAKYRYASLNDGGTLWETRR